MAQQTARLINMRTALVTLKVIYSALTLYVLLNTLTHFALSDEGHHYVIAMVMAMTLLTFPIGLVVLLLTWLLLLLLGTLFASYMGGLSPHARAIWLVMLVVLWMSMYAAGYYQWFIFVPRKIRGHRAMSGLDATKL